jgi:hypothetical protein
LAASPAVVGERFLTLPQPRTGIDVLVISIPFAAFRRQYWTTRGMREHNRATREGRFLRHNRFAAASASDDCTHWRTAAATTLRLS